VCETLWLDGEDGYESSKKAEGLDPYRFLDCAVVGHICELHRYENCTHLHGVFLGGQRHERCGIRERKRQSFTLRHKGKGAEPVVCQLLG